MGPVPAPGASKVVMVCADIGLDNAKAIRTIAAAGTSGRASRVVVFTDGSAPSRSFLFAK